MSNSAVMVITLHHTYLLKI